MATRNHCSLIPLLFVWSYLSDFVVPHIYLDEGWTELKFGGICLCLSFNFFYNPSLHPWTWAWNPNVNYTKLLCLWIVSVIVCQTPVTASELITSVKSLPAMQERQIHSLGWKDPLEKEMGIHSSILAWRTPWTEEPGGLQSMRLQRVVHGWPIRQ